MIAFVNTKEQAALALVEKAMEGSQPIAPDDADLTYLMMQNRTTSRLQDLMPMRGRGVSLAEPPLETIPTETTPTETSPTVTSGKIDGSDITTAILASLPTVLNQQFKDDLKALNDYSKLGDKATQEQEQSALEAYGRVGKQLKLAIVTPVIALAIKAKLSETVGPGFAGTIASVAAGPLAEMAVAAQGMQEYMVKEVINRGLRLVGITSISTDRMDLFMAATIGKFTGNILEEVEKREKDGTLRGDIMTAKAQEGQLTR